MSVVRRYDRTTLVMTQRRVVNFRALCSSLLGKSYGLASQQTTLIPSYLQGADLRFTCPEFSSSS